MKNYHLATLRALRKKPAKLEKRQLEELYPFKTVPTVLVNYGCDN
jgi:hypothetical protein